MTGDRTPIPLLQTEFAETAGQLSPDGKWIAYQSGETGNPDVYVQTVPASGNKWKISNNGGLLPRWANGSAELIFLEAANSGLVSVQVKAKSNPPQFEASVPKPLMRGIVANYDVTADGQRILVDGDSDSFNNRSKLNVIVNWSKELLRKK